MDKFDFGSIRNFEITQERAKELNDGDLSEITYQVYRGVTLGDRFEQVLVEVMSLVSPRGEAGLQIEIAWQPESDMTGDYERSYEFNRETIALFWIPMMHSSNLSSALNTISREMIKRMDLTV